MFGVKQTVKVTQHNQVRGKQWQKFLSVKHHYNLLLHSHQQQQQKNNRIFFFSSHVTVAEWTRIQPHFIVIILSIYFLKWKQKKRFNVKWNRWGGEAWTFKDPNGDSSPKRGRVQ